jgi:HEAT repeat protein
LRRIVCIVIAAVAPLFTLAWPVHRLILPQSVAAATSDDAGKEVAALMDSIIARGEGHIGNVRTNTWVPPTAEDQAKIRKIGHDAIGPLNKALDSQRPFRQLLAVRLLAAIGGPDIVPPLNRAFDPSRANSVRMASLSAMRSVPDDIAIPIIRRALKDSDPLVAQRARDILIQYYHLQNLE